MVHRMWHFVVLALLASGSLVSLAIAADTPGQRLRPAAQDPAASQPASRPEHWDQTITRQNKPGDLLEINLSKAHPREGKYVAWLRIRWGNLDKQLPGVGKEYYSNWDGSVTFASGATGVVERKISFDDGPTSRPASQPAGNEKPRQRRQQQANNGEPGPGSGRDKLIQGSGSQIVWKAGVVGGIDGLLIKITSDSPTPSGTIKAGKFSVDFKANAGRAGVAAPK